MRRRVEIPDAGLALIRVLALALAGKPFNGSSTWGEFPELFSSDYMGNHHP